MTPEDIARVKIDRMFAEAGWAVVNRDDYEPTMCAVAVREAMLKDNLRADYFLMINGKACGVFEAKREDVDVASASVSEQVATYAKKVPAYYQAWQNPLPLLYKSNAKVVDFQDYRKSSGEWVELNRIHTPKEVADMLGIVDPFAGLPVLRRKGLRTCQFEAVSRLESSFRQGKRRALMVLATGAGKTYTACLAAYRMLAYTPMRRVLFLVDRNNLAKQAEGEFATFRLTHNGEAFNNIYSVNRLRSSALPNDSNVLISTIQRLFSLLKGEDIVDSDDDDDDCAASEVALPDNPHLPHDFFDLIVIDECHRSIYGNWRRVLEYFDTARLIGLTATPIPETIAFFDNNLIVNYTLENSIVDGVNVDCRVYRIKTEATENGGAIKQGERVKVVTRYTGKTEEVSNKETKNYSKTELNRSVINPSQIRLILETFRDAVYSEMFNDPQREPLFEYLPKTLIFALNEAHATNVVNIAREVFAEVCPCADMSRYVQKITYSSGDSNELIRQFRNDRDFRVAVTCTLVATGTDVKPLEVVMFLRDVESEPLYVQMKGRGVRTIGDEQLRNVTPNAFGKDCFFLVDAVGVTEHTMSVPVPADTSDSEPITLKVLLERIAHGNLPDSYLRRLASTLSRLYNKADNDQRAEFGRLAHDSMQAVASRLYGALKSNLLPPFSDVNEPNEVRKALVAPVANHAAVRKYIIILAAGFVSTLMPGSDTLLSKGFSVEEAREATSSFERYCLDNQDKIEALRILYNQSGEPVSYAMLKDLENKLKMVNNKFSAKILWGSYAIVSPGRVRPASKREEAEALTNIIQLVRFAFRQIERLDCVCATARQYFNLWCGQWHRDVSDAQRQLLGEVVDYIAANGACTVRDIRDDDMTRAARLIQAFGSTQSADEALLSLFNFVVLRKTA